MKTDDQRTLSQMIVTQLEAMGVSVKYCRVFTNADGVTMAEAYFPVGCAECCIHPDDERRLAAACRAVDPSWMLGLIANSIIVTYLWQHAKDHLLMA